MSKKISLFLGKEVKFKSKNLSDITYFENKDICILQKKSNMAGHVFKISSSKWKGKRFHVLATAGGITASVMAYYFSKGENQRVSADRESVSFLYVAMISVNSNRRYFWFASLW